MVQTSWKITRWYYRCNFRLDVVLLNTSFLSCVRLRCHHSQNNVCWRLVTSTSLLLLLSRVSRVWLCATPSLGFSRQEHWSGLPFPFPLHESEKWKGSRSVMSDSATPWTAAYQAPPSMGFSRQEYWSRVPLPSLNFYLTFYFLFFSTLLFIKLGNWLPGYKSLRSARSRLGFRPILLKRNEIYFVY